MKRLNEAWFRFGGVDSTDMGVTMVEMPKRSLPTLKGRFRTVSGQDGEQLVSDGTYENVELSFAFDVRNRDDVSAVDGWLTGTGRIRFSDEEDREYQVLRIKSLSRSSITKHLDGQRYKATLTCHPFKYGWPYAKAKEFTTSGGKLTNPGTAPSKPRVKITGSGDFSVSIGLETLFFSNVSGGGIIVDSELMDAFTYDGANLANDNVSGQFWAIRPGVNFVTWVVEEGSVSKVEILPRWRWK